jgi:hypothetical protein
VRNATAPSNAAWSKGKGPDASIARYNWVMKNIDEFAKMATARFLESQQGPGMEKYQLALPAHAVDNLIRCAFYASLIPDEGRWPRTTITCYPKGAETTIHFLLADSEEVTAHEIAKLAQAVGEDCHLCCVSKGGGLRICGIHVMRLHERRDLGYGTPRLTNPLKVSILGPGHIDMSTGGIALVYKQGEISEERLLPESPVLRMLANLVKKEMAEFTQGTVESIEDIIGDLAKAIMRKGHGGILLFTDTHKKPFFSTFRELQSRMLQDPMYEYWNCVAQLLANADKNALLSTPPFRMPEVNRYSILLDKQTEILEKCIAAVGHLAGLDGAIALNFECKVVAFNAIIKKMDVDHSVFQFVNGDGEDLHGYENVTNGRGSRHQSALSYVMAVPKSFAFVISQDGSVAAFHSADNKVIVCDRGLRVVE